MTLTKVFVILNSRQIVPIIGFCLGWQSSTPGFYKIQANTTKYLRERLWVISKLKNEFGNIFPIVCLFENEYAEKI